jgi:endonuclease/exonuclease/phosphatase family metal-dependent hydrolase
MTYNILFSFPNPEFDPWSVRREIVAADIFRYDPDLVGFQEPFPDQVKDIAERCPDLVPLHHEVDTDATILYRQSRFAVLETGSYWLSPSPDVPYSTGFGNFFPRLVIWARMVDASSGMEFFFVNTHFDNTSPSQEMSAPLFLERTAPLAGELPVIVTGDFNSRPGSEAYGILTQGIDPGQAGGFRLQDSFLFAQSHEVAARPGDPTDFDPGSRIDHIFVAGGSFSCPLWTVDMSTYGEERRYPSDHFPVTASLRVSGALSGVR